MASGRKRGEVWEFVVKRAGVLEKPLYLTFATEAEGVQYCKNLEALLDRGIVPTEYQVRPKFVTLGQVISDYLKEATPSPKDRDALNTVTKAKGHTPVTSINSDWVDGWIADMKRIEVLAPATIRAKIGATARCTDWAVRKKLILLPDHPFRTLPEGYASYSDSDIAHAGEHRTDIERERRLQAGEEDRIKAVILSGVLPRDSRPRQLEHVPELLAFFSLALETAMRMREMYTLYTYQIDMLKKTIFLDKTKNGDRRSVPLSSVALKIVQPLVEGKDGLVFPWWDGKRESLRRTTTNLSSLFMSIFECAGCEDLHVHDLRAEATSRLFERTNLSDIEIARITGHRDLRVLARRYARLRASDLASRLW